MNVRTYVRFGNERGVYFFSINVDDPFVSIGGNLASLPFSQAGMAMKKQKDGSFHFAANRLFANQKHSFDVSYTPDTTMFTPQNDSLSSFLTERYCIWTFRGNTIVKAPIFHTHWQLQKAAITVHTGDNFPVPITKETLAYYAHHKHAFIHPFEKTGIASSH